eukprot:PITA_29995
MLHGTPTVKEALAYRGILDLFSQASGMEINFSKSTIFFFNTHPAVQAHLSLGFRIGSLPSKYLGAPLTLKPWQKIHWEKVLANMKKKCSHWTNRALNLAGRLIPTQAVLQAIPKYLLSMLLAPEGILQQMRNIQRSFLWNGNGDKKKWGLVAWNKLCQPKSMGGLNLVDPWVVNRTCGAKIWDPIWRKWINLNPGNTEENNESSQQFSERILKINIWKTEEDDKLRWGLKGNGNFSLKEARNIIEKEEQVEVVPWCSKVWDSLLWPKIKSFLWLLMRNKTLTWDNLCKKGFWGPSRCPMCFVEEETMNHLFNACEWEN